LEREKECREFLEKYSVGEHVISGPYIEDGRWVVEVPRKHTDAVKLLEEKLKMGGKSAGVAELISEALKSKFNLSVNEEILETYSGNREFAEFLVEFLEGKPFWLKANQA
jgi:tRNA nucleotidyltransferase (CCA-adding enzyme)